MSKNLLYYGDNLDVLRRHVKDETIDLVYLDPPFNSNANYNVLFASKDGTQAAAQIQAFEDTWRWDESAARLFSETVGAGGRVADVMLAFDRFLGPSDMLAYLAMMAPRLIELRRVLKPTGSLYLHCDPTASHYLKLLLDAVFGPENFRNEIVWKRTGAHSAAKRWNVVHDIVLYYSKTNAYVWNGGVVPHSDEYAARFKRVDEKGEHWTDDNLTAPGVRHGDSGAEWRGYDPTLRGCHWKVNLKTIVELVGVERATALSTTEKLDLLDQHKFILWPKKTAAEGGGFPRFKRFLSGGQAIQDVVTDIPPINSQAQERLGYPTQKPVALLERIIEASSNSGDLVLDPFCGCGTTIEAAHKLGRSWVGIDVTHLAISLIKARLRDALGEQANYSVVGEPTTAEDAAALAHSDKYQFQWWALGLVGARPVDQKKGADRGIDGRSYLQFGGSTCQIIYSVKGGQLKATDVRDLRGVVERERADIGVLISFEPPTKLMKAEAAKGDFYKSPWGEHPRLQILTVAELLEGKTVDAPKTGGVNITYKAAPRAALKVAAAPSLFDTVPEPPTPSKIKRKRKKA